MAISYNEKFIDSLKAVTKISNKVVIQQTETDKVIIAQQSAGREINIFVEAPQTAFNYDKDIAIGDFNNFYSVFKATGDQPKLEISEANGQANVVHINGDATKVDYGLSIASLMQAGKTVLPNADLENTVSVNITEHELKNIKQLTSSLIVAGSSTGTKLNILKELGSNKVRLTFKAHESVGHKFVKEFETATDTDIEIKLVFDPLFFTWLPNNDYEFSIITGENVINHIKATGIVLDDNDNSEVCTQSFIAGPVRVSYDA